MKGYIYRIYDNTNGNVYYGSTTQKVSQRVSEHRRHYKQYLNGTSPYVRSYDIIANEDYDYNIEEVIDCENKYELRKRERWYIENNDCINKCIPTRSIKEWCETNKDKTKEYNKEYYQKNKEQRKEYYEKNRDKKKEQSSEYYEKNKEKLKEYMKEYYQKHKSKWY